MALAKGRKCHTYMNDFKEIVIFDGLLAERQQRKKEMQTCLIKNDEHKDTKLKGMKVFCSLIGLFCVDPLTLRNTSSSINVG